MLKYVPRFIFVLLEMKYSSGIYGCQAFKILAVETSFSLHLYKNTTTRISSLLENFAGYKHKHSSLASPEILLFWNRKPWEAL